jgi:hypothetical protein
MRTALVIAALSLGVTGCGRLHLTGEKRTPAPAAPTATTASKPPDYVKVVGSGSAAGNAMATTSSVAFSGLLHGPIRAEAAAPLDGKIADPAQRALMAQAEARRMALRNMGQLILRLRTSQGGSIGESLKNNPTEQSKLNALLEEQAKVTFANEGQGIHATAVIEGERVMDALGFLAPQIAAAPTGAALEAKKEASYALAVEDAKKKLEQTLLEDKLPDGRTVRQGLADNPDAALDFNAMLWVVQPDETRYLSDGSCEVTIFFDRNRLPEVFAKHKRHWWQFWRKA